MKIKLCLSTLPLYPIIQIEDKYSLIQNNLCFSQIIHSFDFSRVMSKLQRLKFNKKPFNIPASIKTVQGYSTFFIESYIDKDIIYITLTKEKKVTLK